MIFLYAYALAVATWVFYLAAMSLQPHLKTMRPFARVHGYAVRPGGRPLLGRQLCHSTHAFYSAGSKSLSAELTQLRITTTGTPDDFDAGAISISYE